MEFPKAGSGPNRKQIIDALRNTAQSASNMVAENVSIPVDAIAWALRKAGMPVDKPVMGSDWMREKGLTAPTQEGASKMVGDTIGMISPMGFTKQGAQAMIEAGGKLKGLPVGMSIKDVSGPQSQALMLAQQRAALPVEQGGLGLAAGNTPAERAAAMGFDYVRRSQKQKTPFNDVDYAMFVESKGDYDNALDAVSSYGKSQWLGRAEEDVTKYQKDIVKAIRRNDLQREYNSTAAALARDANPRDIVDSAGLWDAPDLAAVSIDALNDLGVKGVKTQDGAVIWDPENIRSRFAAFDPFRKTAATAALMGVAAPDLLAQERDK